MGKTKPAEGETVQNEFCVVVEKEGVAWEMLAYNLACCLLSLFPGTKVNLKTPSGEVYIDVYGVFTEISQSASGKAFQCDSLQTSANDKPWLDLLTQPVPSHYDFLSYGGVSNVSKVQGLIIEDLDRIIKAACNSVSRPAIYDLQTILARL